MANLNMHHFKHRGKNRKEIKIKREKVKEKDLPKTHTIIIFTRKKSVYLCLLLPLTTMFRKKKPWQKVFYFNFFLKELLKTSKLNKENHRKCYVFVFATTKKKRIEEEKKNHQ